VITALGITLVAGLATGIGSLIAFVTHRTNNRLLALGLGFSAGVMIYLSFMEIMPEAIDPLTVQFGARTGYSIAVISFFFGILLSALIDYFVPSCENPHEYQFVETPKCHRRHGHRDHSQQRLYRMGVFVAIAIVIHNIPEGIATFFASLRDPRLGISLGIAIMLHNIPEGIAVSMPFYYATGSRKKAFIYSSLSGFAEPLGALVGYCILSPFLNDTIFNILLAGIAGIMIYISLDELLPAAEECGEHHLCIWGLIGGMAIMAMSLLLFI
jgi:ZIP family zinc transporter